MITLSRLPKTTKHPKKRRGLGLGSGKGKTAGRGTKGQKARGKIRSSIAQGGSFLVRRLPLYRGKFRNKPHRGKAIGVNVKHLNSLPKGSVVDKELLIARHIIDKRIGDTGVKILGDGELTVSLTVRLACSKSAISKIKKAGGKVETV